MIINSTQAIALMTVLKESLEYGVEGKFTLDLETRERLYNQIVEQQSKSIIDTDSSPTETG